MDAANRAFGNVILIFQPDKERGHDPADIIQCHFPGTMYFLITTQIEADIIGFYFAYIFRDRFQHIS